MRALVTGAGGQLGVELLNIAPRHYTVIGLRHLECDVSDPASVIRVVQTHQPDVVINAAAFTAVDEAETQAEHAAATNARGAGNVARAANMVGARTIQVSTDYVFDGASREPYSPTSRTNPINVYGASKLAGENEVLDSSSNALVIRSSWLYAPHGKNFLRSILGALRGNRPLRVVSDQIGVPTSARSLATAIWACVDQPALRGIQHWVDSGEATWYEFALEIYQVALARGIVVETAIVPVQSADYPSRARRPAYSVLDARDLWSSLGTPPSWRERLAEIVLEASRSPG